MQRIILFLILTIIPLVVVLPPNLRKMNITKTSEPIKEYKIVDSGSTIDGRGTYRHSFVKINWQNHLWRSNIPDYIYKEYEEDSTNNTSVLYSLTYYYDKSDNEILCYEHVRENYSESIVCSIVVIIAICSICFRRYDEEEEEEEAE